MSHLNDRLLAAHARNDGVALADLYREAADSAANPDAEAFFLTHAYVFALEAALPLADTLRVRLTRMGREPE